MTNNRRRKIEQREAPSQNGSQCNSLRDRLPSIVIGCACLFVLCCFLPSVSQSQQTDDQTENTQGSETPNPPVLLQLRSDVEISSYVVRVRDVVLPIGTPPDRWQELSGKAIGLISVDGRRMRMERQRISEFLERSGLLRQSAQWSGPDFVSIAYVEQQLPPEYPPPRVEQAAARSKPRMHDNFVRTADYQRLSGMQATDPNDITAVRSIEKAKPTLPNLFPAERNRIERMILAALPKTHEEVLQRFEVSIPHDDNGVNGLKDLRAVRSLRLSEAPRSGRIELWVAGETELDEVESAVEIELIELPVVVYTTTALSRGDVLTARDLVAKPIPIKQFDSRLVTDIETLIDKEVVRPLSANRPVTFQDVSEPVIIKRGDQVELRVVGAGITVVTNARALAPAAGGESVMVECDQTKQKLSARAVRSGVVEIVTRPPTTQKLPGAYYEEQR